MIFLATVSSMILVSLFGILVGKYVGKKIPQVTLNYFAAFLFLLFGTLKLYGAVDAGFKTPFWIILYALILAIAVVYTLILNQKARKKRDSRYLYEAYKRVRSAKTPEEEAAIAKEIEAITGKYFGEDIPFIGDVLAHVERIHGVDPEIYDDIKKL